MPAYCPRRGDIVWLTFDPQLGREQAGRRPALILSPESYNRKTETAICCPITSREKGYPFEVRIPEGLGVSGVVLSDAIKSLDWKMRKVKYCCRAPSFTLWDVLAKFNNLVTAKPS